VILIMDAIRLIVAPVRRVANSRVFQVALVIAIILSLDHYSYDYAVLGSIAYGLKDLVTATVQLCSQYVRVGILTDPVLQVGLMIAYVYIACLIAFFLLRLATAFIIDLIGSSNFLWLRTAIARERGIAAYRAWLPQSGSDRETFRRTSGKGPLRGLRATCRPILPCFAGLRAL
jgi:hypothetical protein